VAAIDWRLTGQPGIATAAGARLADSALVTGPVTASGGLAGDESGGVGKVLGGIGAWTTAGALVAVVVLLAASALSAPGGRLGIRRSLPT
jgi:hypothetical protein